MLAVNCNIFLCDDGDCGDTCAVVEGAHAAPEALLKSATDWDYAPGAYKRGPIHGPDWRGQFMALARNSWAQRVGPDCGLHQVATKSSSRPTWAPSTAT
jgi:hypothetical protein